MTRTTAPKGSALATARIQAHQAIDVFWRFDAMTRGQAYEWLAEKMNLKLADCHIGMFDIEQCRQVVAVCERAGLEAKASGN